MNGLIDDSKGRKSVVFDTNVIIKFINKLPGFIDLKTRFAGNERFVIILASSVSAQAKKPLSKHSLLYATLGFFILSTLIFAVLFIFK
jgi:hypothetical protein